MANVIGLKLVLYKLPDRVPKLVKLLTERVNPHIWYASCVAAGIDMARTRNSEYISLLKPMLEEMNDFVG